MHRSYWHRMPNMPEDDVPGKLIVLEGTDGVGRSTQIGMLRAWLESSGLAVHDTGFTRSNLAGRHLQKAKEGHTLGTITQALYYATDFADRLENDMYPALRAGYIVLTDRYIFSLIARAVVRGAAPKWLRRAYGFALVPDLILYMKADVDTIIPRALASGGFDYWESGADYIQAPNRYERFIKHQQALLDAFESMQEEYGFVVVDANRPVRAVFEELRGHIEGAVAGIKRATEEFVAVPEMPSVVPRVPEEDAGRSVSDILGDLLDALRDE